MKSLALRPLNDFVYLHLRVYVREQLISYRGDRLVLLQY